MVASITVHLQIFNHPQLPHFSTDLDETGIKIHVLLPGKIFHIKHTNYQSCRPFNSLVANSELSSADNLCKQFGPKSGPTERRS